MPAQESATGHQTIELHGDDEGAVLEMLRFIYGDLTKLMCERNIADTENKDIGEPCIQLYLVADKYAINDLKARACSAIADAVECGPTCDEHEIDIYTGLRLFFDRAADRQADIEDVVAVLACYAG